MILDTDSIFNPSLSHNMILAQQVHHALLNAIGFSDFPLSIGRYFKTAEKIGGDFWVAFQQMGKRNAWSDSGAGIITLETEPTQDVMIGIGDVSGHGIPAALIMALSVGMINQLSHQPIAELMTAYNRDLVRQLGGLPTTYVTCVLACISVETKQLAYVRAGHPPIVILRHQMAHVLEQGGTFLGMYDDEQYEAHVVELKSGDRLIIYSDGVTEAVDPISNTPYGIHGLIHFFQETRGVSPQDATAQFAASREAWGMPLDDQTLLLIDIP